MLSFKEEFEYTKGMIRSHKKDRKHNGQTKKPSSGPNLIAKTTIYNIYSFFLMKFL
jgi:hypothetical protein